MAHHCVLRPLTTTDGDELWKLVTTAGDVTGMTALPDDRRGADRLCEDTADVVVALAAGAYKAEPGTAQRLVLGLTVDEALVGFTGCTFKTQIPNLGVRIETSPDGRGLVMHSAAQPWTRTELDSSYLAPDARGKGLGSLLSRGRFLLLHLISARIPSTIVSHLRGLFDERGHAPFWRHFGARLAPEWGTSVEAEAALRANPAELAKLASRSLPVTPEVLDCLGWVNEASIPAFLALRREGLVPTELFDPVDGGPTVEAELDDTVSARRRRHGRASIGGASADALVATGGIESFRVARGLAGFGEPGRIALDRSTADVLGIGDGALVSVLPLAEEAL